jgi:hypothetical protein
VAGIDRPAKKTAHGVEEIPGLCRRIGPAVAAGGDMLAFDRRGLLMAGQLEHAAHDVLALSPGGEGKHGPGCRFAVPFPKSLSRRWYRRGPARNESPPE